PAARPAARPGDAPEHPPVRAGGRRPDRRLDDAAARLDLSRPDVPGRRPPARPLVRRPPLAVRRPPALGPARPPAPRPVLQADEEAPRATGPRQRRRRLRGPGGSRAGDPRPAAVVAQPRPWGVSQTSG